MRNTYLALLLFCGSLWSQQYQKDWDKVLVLENTGKIKSADRLVSKIHSKAEKTENEAQLVKCFFYRSKYLFDFEPNARIKILGQLRAQSDPEASGPKSSVQALYNVIYAKCLTEYAQRNYNSISRASPTDSLPGQDISLWTHRDFDEEIARAYNRSLADSAALKKIPLTRFEQIFDYLRAEKFARQSLFDYILSENIEYFKYGGVYYRENKYRAFITDKSESLLTADSKTFASGRFDTVSNAKERHVLELLQLREKSQPDAANRLDRIEWLFLPKNPKRLEALFKCAAHTRDTLDLNNIRFEIAYFYNANANRETNSDYYQKAIVYLDSIISIGKINSNAHLKALSMRQAILQKSLSANLEPIVYENQNSRAFLKFRNMESVTVSCFRSHARFQGKGQNRNLDEAVKTKDSIPVYTHTFALPPKDDHFEHSTEILMPKLPVGTYTVRFSSNRDTLGIEAFCIVTVSNLHWAKMQQEDKQIYTIVHRKTGKSIQNAILTLADKPGSYKTDLNGMVTLHDAEDKYRRVSGWITKGNDSLAIEYYSRYYGKQKNQNSSKTELFLDRGIYRPGQTVYFKGVVVCKDSLETSTPAKVRLDLKAFDSDDKEIFKTTVETNEFGSFSGEFKLPEQGVTGGYYINTSKPEALPGLVSDASETFWETTNFAPAYTHFRVEEYKRPKFEVSFEPVKERFRLEKPVTIYANAKALAGSDVSGAKVKYTVKLATIDYKQDYPDAYSRYRSEYIDELVAEDSTQTDEKGRFPIRFTADYDENEDEEDRELLPIYNYEIEVSVTDLNGETRTAVKMMKVGNHNLELSFYCADLEKRKGNIINLFSSDLNDESKPVNGKLRFRRVRKPQQHFKQRAFQKPEIPGFSSADFKQLFPNEILAEELTEGLDSSFVKTIDVNTAKSKRIEADLSDLPPGNYEIVFSANDEFGNAIEFNAQRKLTDPKSKIDASKLLSVKTLNADPKKDGFAMVRVTSVIPDLEFRISAVNNRSVILEKTLQMTQNESVVKIPLLEYRSGIAITVDAFQDNYFESQNLWIPIPEPMPELTIETESYRNLIEPESKQTWAFRIKSKNTPVETEVLASMYDMSLDAFTQTDWHSTAIRDWALPNYRNREIQYVVKESIQMYERASKPGRTLRPEETQLIWFGFNINNAQGDKAEKIYRDQLARKAPKPVNSKLVYGIVSDNSGVLPGANIMVKGTQRGVQSDVDGYYEIEVAQGETLVFSFVGMQDTQVTVSAQKEINVVLQEGGISLGEVVVTGALGISKKLDARTATSRVVYEDNLYKEETAMQLLGKVSGLEITTTGYGAATNTKVMLRGDRSTGESNEALFVIDGQISTLAEFQSMKPTDIISVDVLKGAQGAALYGRQGTNGVIVVTTKKTVEALSQVKTRKNVSETAFFFPHLRTDAKGGLSFSFTSPEALTTWKLRLLAHNKKGISAQLQQKIATQKKLMVMPNLPRFFHEKDSIHISAKISNMTAQELKGNVMLELSDAATMKNADIECANKLKIKPFKAIGLGNTSVQWKIFVPEGLSGLHYRIVAQSGEFSDGEESIVPLVSNRMLITESKPLWVREKSKKEVVFENLKNNSSSTLSHHKMTLEFTSNPTWLALQSLPYLMEYEHECAEQTFARFYANAIATSVVESNPKIAEVFANWRKNGSGKLEQNQELKSILANETPWFQDAMTESAQKQRLALLFDLDHMRQSQNTIFTKLKQKQRESGGFGWFDGSADDAYITRHIAAGLGHLKKLGIQKSSGQDVMDISKGAVTFMDADFARWKATQNSHKRWGKGSYTTLHYLYARSFFLDEIPVNRDLLDEIKAGLNVIVNERFNLALYEKAMAVLVLNRFGKKKEAEELIENLRETSVADETYGLYWIQNQPGWYWYNSPIETQALLIEAFGEVADDEKSVEAMKAWLIKNKQTSHWPTTKSTTEAVYALLLKGNKWTDTKDEVIFTVGDQKIDTEKLVENAKESEAGYVKINWKANEINPKMATLKIENKGNVTGFGGFYWQYFEDSDQVVKSEKGPMTVAQELFRKVNTTDGVKLRKLENNSRLAVGDLIVMRLTVKSTEDLEYVHLKSMRASCFEPVDVLSGYESEGNLWFYKSTKDVATHFFFDRLKAGSYILEYDVRVNNAGDFSNGISTIQSMYAPVFSAHSKGIRVNVK